MKRKYVITDLDHVVADAAWRDHLIPNWDEYHAASAKDEPLDDICYLLNCLHNFGHFIIGLTGRTERWKNLSSFWLVAKGVPVDDLLMRPDKDFRPAPQVKLDLMDLHYPDWRENTAFILDDREDICTAFKAYNITTLQVTARRRI